MSISFTQISSDLRSPGQYIEIDPSRGGSRGTGQRKRILVIGQRRSTGTGAALTPTLVASVDQVAGETGQGSLIHNLVAAVKRASQYTETWFIAINDDVAGTVATKTVTLTGPATAAGTLCLYIGGVLVRAAVGATDTAAAVATTLAAAVNANASLPFTAGAASAVVTLSCRHKGAWANDLDVRINYRRGDVLPAGLGVTIAVGVSGTANPLIDTAIAALGARPYTHIVMPYTDSANLALLDEELERRWSATVQKEALAFAGKSGTLGTATTFGTSRNEKAVSVMPTGPSPTPPWIFGAVVAAVDAAEPIPNRPRQTLALPGVLAPAEGAEWGLAEHEVLLHDGLSTYTVDPDGTVRIGRLVTTYQTNAYGLPDDAYLDVEKMTLLARLRYERRTRIAHKFGRNRLAANSQRIPPGSDIITTDDIRDDFFAQFIEWIEAGWVYDDMPALKAGYVCEIDPNDPNRVNELIPPELVGGLRVFAGLIQFRN